MQVLLTALLAMAASRRFDLNRETCLKQKPYKKTDAMAVAPPEPHPREASSGMWAERTAGRCAARAQTKGPHLPHVRTQNSMSSGATSDPPSWYETRCCH